MQYYLGAYHLLKLKPLTFGKYAGQKISTGSRCLNESYFDSWALSWTPLEKKELIELKNEFDINKAQLKAIQEWADQKFNEKHLGWVNTFNDLETLREYQSTFFSDATDYETIGIYLPEDAVQAFKKEFAPQSENTGEIGILDCLIQEIPEVLDKETFVGYDLIGMECSGDYHSFHCYNISDEIKDKFGVTINEKGLINEFENKQALLDYANNPDNGLPCVPWYLVKVKTVEG